MQEINKKKTTFVSDFSQSVGRSRTYKQLFKRFFCMHFRKEKSINKFVVFSSLQILCSILLFLKVVRHINPGIQEKNLTNSEKIDKRKTHCTGKLYRFCLWDCLGFCQEKKSREKKVNFTQFSSFISLFIFKQYKKTDFAFCFNLSHITSITFMS